MTDNERQHPPHVYESIGFQKVTLFGAGTDSGTFDYFTLGWG